MAAAALGSGTNRSTSVAKAALRLDDREEGERASIAEAAKRVGYESGPSSLWKGGMTEVRRLDYTVGGTATSGAAASVTTLESRRRPRSPVRFSPRVDVLEEATGAPPGLAGPTPIVADLARRTLDRCDATRPEADEARLEAFLTGIACTFFCPPNAGGSPEPVPSAVVECAERLAALLAAKGDAAACENWRAKVWYARASDVAARPSAPATRLARLAACRLAATYVETAHDGGADRAREVLEIAAATAGRVLGETHPEALAAVESLASAEVASGRAAAAAARLAVAVAARAHALGDSHPITRATRRALANARAAVARAAPSTRTPHVTTVPAAAVERAGTAPSDDKSDDEAWALARAALHLAQSLESLERDRPSRRDNRPSRPRSAPAWRPHRSSSDRPTPLERRDSLPPTQRGDSRRVRRAQDACEGARALLRRIERVDGTSRRRPMSASPCAPASPHNHGQQRVPRSSATNGHVAVARR